MQRTGYWDLLAGVCLCLLVPERELLDELLPGQHRLPVPAVHYSQVNNPSGFKEKIPSRKKVIDIGAVSS